MNIEDRRSTLLRRNASLEEAISSHTEKLQSANRLLEDIVHGMAHGVLCFSSGKFEEQEILLSNATVADYLEVPKEMVAPGTSRKELLNFCTERGDFGRTSSDSAEKWFVPSENKRSVKYDRIVPSGRIIQSLASLSTSGTTVVTFTDVTEIKQKETDLDAARRAAISASQSKSEFLSNMSHEIRTPMNGVLGIAELMRTTELDDVQRNYVNVIIQSGRILLTILNDVLDFSKIEAGKMELAAIPFNADKMTSEAITLMTAAAKDKQIELHYASNIREGVRYVGDRVRLMQILTNLVGNAIKFTDTGQVSVDVSRRALNAEADVVRFEVSDTGMGVPNDEIERIFENFSQIEGSAAERPAGTGLGLAICRQLVSLMSGEIGAHSVLGRGSTFWFEVPLKIMKPDPRLLDSQVSAEALKIDEKGAE